jgi:uncharacterized Zn-binding protein involved in type VI secretion
MPGKGIQRVGDLNSGGGVALGPGHNNVLINGRPALIPDTPFTPHPPCSPKAPQHCVGVVAVVGNATTVFANGIPLVLTGAKDSCLQHSRAGGSTDVRAV